MYLSAKMCLRMCLQMMRWWPVHPKKADDALDSGNHTLGTDHDGDDESEEDQKTEAVFVRRLQIAVETGQETTQDKSSDGADYCSSTVDRSALATSSVCSRSGPQLELTLSVHSESDDEVNEFVLLEAAEARHCPQ